MIAEWYVPIMMSQFDDISRTIQIKKMEKMKKVIYGKNWDLVYIADQGEYRGVKYFIVAGGIHPCAYVMCDPNFATRHKDGWGSLDCINVHGGVTWVGDAKHLRKHPEGYEGMCFGWDYGHCDDWAGYWNDVDNMMYGNKKWTTDEILYECHNAIDQYLEVMEKEQV